MAYFSRGSFNIGIQENLLLTQNYNGIIKKSLAAFSTFWQLIFAAQRKMSG